MSGLLYEVRNVIKEHRLLEQKDRVLVACSGGPDSVALFYILQEISPEYNLNLYLAHLNHGIRNDTDEDEDFVRQIARNVGIEIVTDKVDCLALSKQWKMSLEGAARKARYAFFENQGRIFGISKIALGHTAEDQAETILMRLFRGSGLQGLAGIFPIRYSGHVCYIRPLIRCQRQEIFAYLSSRNIPYRTDKTNFKRCCTRNRIRLDLIPYLKRTFNPSLVSTLAKTAELLREDHIALEHTVSKIEVQVGSDLKKRGSFQSDWKHHFLSQIPKKKEGFLDVNALKAQPLGIQRRILKNVLFNTIEKSQRIHFKHIEALMKLIHKSGSGGGELNLPGGAKVFRVEEELFLIPNRADQRRHFKNSNRDKRAFIGYPLNVPGNTYLPFFKLTLRTTILDSCTIDKIPSDPTVAFLDYDKLPKPFHIRVRIPGDRFHPLGLPSEKKLKEFFIDGKVPRRIRNIWPLLTGDSKIVWVIGLRIGHPYRVTSNSLRILRIDIVKK